MPLSQTALVGTVVVACHVAWRIRNNPSAPEKICFLLMRLKSNLFLFGSVTTGTTQWIMWNRCLCFLFPAASICMDCLLQMNANSSASWLAVILRIVQALCSYACTSSDCEFLFFFSASLLLCNSRDRNTVLEAKASFGIRSLFWILQQETKICQKESWDGTTSQFFVQWYFHSGIRYWWVIKKAVPQSPRLVKWLDLFFIIAYSASGVLDSSQNILSPAGRSRRQPAISTRRKSRQQNRHAINRYTNTFLQFCCPYSVL